MNSGPSTSTEAGFSSHSNCKSEGYNDKVQINEKTTSIKQMKQVLPKYFPERETKHQQLFCVN